MNVLLIIVLVVVGIFVFWIFLNLRRDRVSKSLETSYKPIVDSKSLKDFQDSMVNDVFETPKVNQEFQNTNYPETPKSFVCQDCTRKDKVIKVLKSDLNLQIQDLKFQIESLKDVNHKKALALEDKEVEIMQLKRNTNSELDDNLHRAISLISSKKVDGGGGS